MTKIPVDLGNSYMSSQNNNAKTGKSSKDNFDAFSTTFENQKKDVSSYSEKIETKSFSQNNDSNVKHTDSAKKNQDEVNDEYTNQFSDIGIKVREKIVGLSDETQKVEEDSDDLEKLEEIMQNIASIVLTQSDFGAENFNPQEMILDEMNTLDTLSTEEFTAVSDMMKSFQQEVAELLEVETGELENLVTDNTNPGDDILSNEFWDKVLLTNAGEEDASAILMDENLMQKYQELHSKLEHLKDNVQEVLAPVVDDQLGGKVLGEESRRANAYVTGLEESSSKNDLVNSMEDLSNLNLDVRNGNDNFLNNSLQERQDKRENKEDKALFVNTANYNADAQFIRNDSILESMNTQETNTQSYVSETDVMDQVMEQIKFQVKADTTEVNIRLQPETLGTIQIHISSKEGVMTAHFTASSEEVKAILESQMASLQQSLDNQDIKVEVIEVSVQTHMFEHDLEQGREENQNEQSASSKRRRMLRVDGSEDTSDLADDEKLVAEMMAADGNTINYQA